MISSNTEGSETRLRGHGRTCGKVWWGPCVQGGHRKLSLWGNAISADYVEVWMGINCREVGKTFELAEILVRKISHLPQRGSFGAAASSQDFVQVRKERKNFHRNAGVPLYLGWMEIRGLITLQSLGRQECFYEEWRYSTRSDMMTSLEECWLGEKKVSLCFLIHQLTNKRESVRHLCLRLEVSLSKSFAGSVSSRWYFTVWCVILQIIFFKLIHLGRERWKTASKFWVFLYLSEPLVSESLNSI